MSKIYEILVKHIVENQNQFYRAAYSYVKNREAALDVVQNATCKALENYKKLQSKEAMASWFYRILINESLMYLRKERKYIAWDETDNTFLEGIYEEESYEPKIEVLSKISDLPTEMQVIIQLHFFEEKTLKEIAEITETNLNTVKSRLYAACKKLGKEIEKEDNSLNTRHSKSIEKIEKSEKKKEIIQTISEQNTSSKKNKKITQNWKEINFKTNKLAKKEDKRNKSDEKEGKV